jgi:hypothetical protein
VERPPARATVLVSVLFFPFCVPILSLPSFLLFPHHPLSTLKQRQPTHLPVLLRDSHLVIFVSLRANHFSSQFIRARIMCSSTHFLRYLRYCFTSTIQTQTQLVGIRAYISLSSCSVAAHRGGDVALEYRCPPSRLLFISVHSLPSRLCLPPSTTLSCLPLSGRHPYSRSIWLSYYTAPIGTRAGSRCTKIIQSSAQLLC